MRRKSNLTDKREVAERLRKIREGAGYTQERFAEVLDISLSAYKKIEGADNQITLDGLRRINKKFNVSADYLLFGETQNLNEAWKLILNCTDHDKLILFLKLFIYFSDVKGGIFPDKKTLKKSDCRVEELMELLRKEMPELNN